MARKTKEENIIRDATGKRIADIDGAAIVIAGGPCITSIRYMQARGAWEISAYIKRVGASPLLVSQVVAPFTDCPENGKAQ